MYAYSFFTKVFRSATRLFNKSVLQFGQMKIAYDDFRVLQTIVVNKIFQLKGRGEDSPPLSGNVNRIVYNSIFTLVPGHNKMIQNTKLNPYVNPKILLNYIYILNNKELN